MPVDFPLPFRDKKGEGAADFYFAINATFRFVQKQFGHKGLVRYWGELGRSYMEPVQRQWSAGGLPAIARYWRAFFAAEPGADVSVESLPGSVTVRVHTCPAIAHLRKTGRAIVPEYCQHCYFVSEAAAESAGYTVRVAGGAGSCSQIFYRRGEAPAEQELSAIHLNGPTNSPAGNPPGKMRG